MGKVFHPVAYKGKKDDIAGGSWTAPYFQPGRGEDNAFKLSETNCGVAAPVEDESQYTDGMTANHAVEVLTNNSKTRDATGQPFFVAVGFHRPHLPWVVPSKYFDLYDRDEIELPPYKADDLDDLPERINRAKRGRSKIHKELEKKGAVKDAIHGYLACMSYADAMMGRVLDALEASSHADNTIVVLWSDHGYHHGEKYDWGKHTLWERTSNVRLSAR